MAESASAHASARQSKVMPGTGTGGVRRRPLVPKEHGAYFQLAAPVVTALAMGRPTVAAVLFAASAALAFLAHEPLLVLIGHRGASARRQEGKRAAICLSILGSLAIAAGAAAWAEAPSGVGAVLSIPLALVAAVGGLIAAHAERTDVGEIVVGAALSSAALPVARAANVSPEHAWAAWSAWIVVTSAGTCAVRSIIRTNKGTASPLARLLPLAITVAATVVIFAFWPWAALAATPTVALAVALTAVPPHPRHLRRVGWGLAASTVTASVLLVVSVRRTNVRPSDSATERSVKSPTVSPKRPDYRSWSNAVDRQALR